MAREIRLIEDFKKLIVANAVYADKTNFIKEVMSKAIGAGASWSIYDGLQSKEVMEYFAGKCENKLDNCGFAWLSIFLCVL